MPMMRRALLAELLREILLENLREAVDGAQRRAQVVRDRVGKGLQVLIGGREFLGSPLFALLQFRVFAAQALHIQRARDDRQDDVELEGLEDVVERAALHGLHRRIDGAVAGHHDRADGRDRSVVAASISAMPSISGIMRSVSSRSNSPGPQRSQGLLRRAETLRGVALELQACRTARATAPPHRPRSSRRAGGRVMQTNSASAARSSCRRGGLLSTLSTCAGVSFAAMSRCPQPVSRITGVVG